MALQTLKELPTLKALSGLEVYSYLELDILIDSVSKTLRNLHFKLIKNEFPLALLREDLHLSSLSINGLSPDDIIRLCINKHRGFKFSCDSLSLEDFAKITRACP